MNKHWLEKKGRLIGVRAQLRVDCLYLLKNELVQVIARFT